ncbi:envelope integrity protein Cei [Amycolatopsis alkalitolerans]|uniref:LytR family transcriptional regulator n=1 Tax=Amycolatopsis alkalitolerans TaxID=2547244 RepID=A0A5C4M4T5_9PSEU|nr:envelope integrity protein Cei [Amycolatopsis alkalitolerans]TNC27654.1 LytR family transcriptional regulator [Amycolatopsis alkalitolerans]
MASGIGFGNRKKRGYRKRRPLPALVLIGILGLVAMVVWVRAVTTRTDINEVVRCTPAPAPVDGLTFTPLTYTALDDVAPIPPDKIAVQVLNASTSRGQATITTESLRELGFTQIGDPGNDPAYPAQDAGCQGQLRFGDNGRSAARTLSLVLPCVELVKDTRADASVDLSIGTAFGDVRPTQQGRQILQQLQQWSQQHPDGGNEQSAASGPVIDPALLSAARNVTC